MAGALFGMIVALPIGVLIGWAVKGSRSIERNKRAVTADGHPDAAAVACRFTVQHHGSANPVWHQAYPVAASAPQIQPRKYTIGGEEIINHESAAVW